MTTTKAKTPEPAAAKNGNGHRKDKPAEDAGPAKEPAQGSQTAAATPPVVHGHPRDWSDLSIGHLVLATEGGGEGWWEAIVIAVESDMVTLRWRDYAKYPKFSQHRSAVALMKPGAP
jgi:hypothetical protein